MVNHDGLQIDQVCDLAVAAVVDDVVADRNRLVVDKVASNRINETLLVVVTGRNATTAAWRPVTINVIVDWTTATLVALALAGDDRVVNDELRSSITVAVDQRLSTLRGV